jgi:uncharacterized coiled-coil protein SlyX
MGSSSQSGLDPVLDLLGKMESQISRMETRPEPAAPRAAETRSAPDSPELRAFREELAQADQRGNAQLALFTEALTRLRVQIPELVEDAISSRFIEVEERFYTQIREIHQRSTDTFVHSTQARAGTRIASLESTLAEQKQAMSEMRENYEKSDRNIDRMLSGLDRLTAELMRLSTLAGAPIVTRRVAQLSPVIPGSLSAPASAEPRAAAYNDVPSMGRRAALQDFAEGEADSQSRTRKIGRPSNLFVPALLLIILVPLLLIVYQIYSGSSGIRFSRPNSSSPPALTGTAGELKTAANFSAAKDYSKAENIYRGILKGEPENRTAIRELASVLFKQQKYEEAATVLKTLPPNN